MFRWSPEIKSSDQESADEIFNLWAWRTSANLTERNKNYKNIILKRAIIDGRQASDWNLGRTTIYNSSTCISRRFLEWSNRTHPPMSQIFTNKAFSFKFMADFNQNINITCILGWIVMVIENTTSIEILGRNFPPRPNFRFRNCFY